MITFKAIIIPGNRRKDGTYPVKIRVTFKGVSRRLPTTLVCKATDLTRGNKIKNGDILNKTDELIGRMRGAVKDISPFDLDCRDVDWVVSHIRERLSTEEFHLDFFEWCDSFIPTKSRQTQAAYIAALNALERFLGRRRLDINDITRSMLLEFMEHVDKEPRMKKVGDTYIYAGEIKIPKGAPSRHIAKLQHMFSAAKERFNDEDVDRIVIPKSPFDKIKKIFPSSEGQKNLGIPLMQSIISAETDNPVMRIALDAFILSFALMGANMADLYCATPMHNTWMYNRQKTASRRADKAEMRVEIPDEAIPYIYRLQSHRDNGWWLPTLHHLSPNKDACTERVNRMLKKWAREHGVPEFTFYAARHTWASLARKAGVEKATIDECLVHKGDFDMTDIYAERNWELLSEANKKVLALFEWLPGEEVVG